MRVLLMHRDRDFELERKLPPNEQELTQDLELGVLFNAMARDDKFLLEVVRKAVLSSLVDLDPILYRQNILKDCMKNPRTIRDIYKIAVDAIAAEKGVWGMYNPYKSAEQVLGRSVNVLQRFVGKLKEIREIADQDAGKFESEGFRAFFAMLKEELSDAYLARVEGHLKELQFGNGALISAKLGEGNKGISYALCKTRDRRQEQQDKKRGLMSRVLGKNATREYTYTLDINDETGPQMLAELRDRGINNLANTLTQSSDHVLGFFTSLRIELAFYVACLNLQEPLVQRGEPTCFPLPVERGKRALSFQGLYDACLVLKLEKKVVGNDVDAENKDVVIVTGANRGGKSTFLRSIGLAQLMMQCGMFVPAESFSADVCEGLFTHFKREEDSAMKSGKLDEELSRMSGFVDRLSSNCVVLFNESFAATNEREGSEIAGQIVSALLERRIKVLFVTHQYEFARSFYEKNMANALFLRAERRPGGERTFKVIQGEPLQTSHGEDLYNRIFLGIALGAAPAAPAAS
jgi:DNA mismatch repair ATPase MutS